MNKILFKVFGATSKDSYRYIYECFGIDNADQFIRKRQDNAKTTNNYIHTVTLGVRRYDYIQHKVIRAVNLV